MSKEIIVNFDDFSECLSEVNKEKEDLEKQIKKIKKLPFFCETYTGRKSRGSCASKMQKYTYEDMFSAATKLKELIEVTIIFLEKAKEKEAEVDEKVANSYKGG